MVDEEFVIENKNKWRRTEKGKSTARLDRGGEKKKKKKGTRSAQNE
jgi:hypothetical protein